MSINRAVLAQIYNSIDSENLPAEIEATRVRLEALLAVAEMRGLEILKNEENPEWMQ